jgi:hypothetical protein
MLIKVFAALISMFIFYFILLIMFALILSIIDWGNFEFNDDEDIRNVQFTSSGPDKEYLLLNKFVARVFAVIRVSIGDFDFGVTPYLTEF